MDVEYIVADGEHSQFEIVKHACAVGSRVFVGSSGVGWFYAFEAIAVTAGLRLPVVAICGNRALDDPGAFGTEHNDSLAVRDLGWLLPWAETAQEAIGSSTRTTRSRSRLRWTRTGSWRSGCRTTRPCARRRPSSARRTRTSRSSSAEAARARSSTST